MMLNLFRIAFLSGLILAAPALVWSQELGRELLTFSLGEPKSCPPAVTTGKQTKALLAEFEKASVSGDGCRVYAAAAGLAALTSAPEEKLMWQERAIAALVASEDFKRAVIFGVVAMKETKADKSNPVVERIRLQIVRAVAADARRTGLHRESLWLEMALGMTNERVPTFTAYLEDYPESTAVAEVTAMKEELVSMYIDNELGILDQYVGRGELWAVVTRLDGMLAKPVIVGSPRFPEILFRTIESYILFAELLHSGRQSGRGEKWSNQRLAYIVNLPAGEEADRSVFILKVLETAKTLARVLQEEDRQNIWTEKARALMQRADRIAF